MALDRPANASPLGFRKTTRVTAYASGVEARREFVGGPEKIGHRAGASRRGRRRCRAAALMNAATNSASPGYPRK